MAKKPVKIKKFKYVKELQPYWHIHHRILLEFAYSPIKDRRDYIKNHKPQEQVKIRLQRLKPVKEFIGSKKAYNLYLKAKKAGIGVNRYCSKWYAIRGRCLKYANMYRRSVEILSKKVIEAQHKRECENCPWDGTTIFPGNPY